MKKEKNAFIEKYFTSKTAKISMLFLIVTVFVFAGYKVYEITIKDNVPPVVTAPSSILNASVSITNKELLAGVTAVDEKSGDVSGTLMVEKLSSINQDNNRTVYYIALDKNNNVGRAERTLHYTDYELPVFTMDNGCFIVKIDQTIDIMKYIRAYSILDGDLSSFVKYSFDSKLDTSTLGAYPVQLYVTDSAGGVSKLDTNLLVVSDSEIHEKIKLSTYLVYINVGDEFNPEDYVIEGSYTGEISVESTVNTDQKGTYCVDYYVTNTTQYNTYKGRTRLIVIVK